MKNHVYLAAALSLSCATEPQIELEGVREGGAVPAPAVVEEPSPEPQPLSGEQIEAQIAERMASFAAAQRAATEAVPSISAHASPMPTLVQQQPGIYPECFSELPARRRACRADFGRRWPERVIIQRQGDPHHELYDATRLVLGRIFLSEANWPHDERRDRYFPEQNHAEIDAPAIYQVLRHTRRNGETLLGAMRRHSPHVSEARAIEGRLVERRMNWIVSLQLDCDEPRGFPETDAEGNQLDYERDYRPRCEALFALATSFVDGEAAEPWADAPLVTWGGRCEDVAGACDDHLGSHRGLVPFETGTTANRFWCNPHSAGCDGPPLDTVLAAMESAPSATVDR